MRFDETKRKCGLTLGVMTVSASNFQWTARSEVYRIIYAQQVFCIINYYFPSDSQTM